MKSLRFAKLMQSMGLDKKPEKPRVSSGERLPMSPERQEALTGSENPEAQKKRQMQMILDSKIAELESSDDPNAMESLNFWKNKKKQLGLE